MKPVLRAISAVLGNISGTWFVLAFATPNFSDLRLRESQLTLIVDLIFGTVFLVFVILIERLQEHEQL